ncbi:MAG: ATP12 family chaperone protein [Sphingomicrobium sp.]
MKRFWTEVAVVEGEGGWRILLDDRLLKTPARAPLAIPAEPLARAISEEWSSALPEFDPRAMPLTGLANVAIDRVKVDRAAFAAGVARYAEADLLCYRAETPQALVERERRTWDPLLMWARRRFDVDFEVTSGVAPVRQPQATVVRLEQAVAPLDAFRLAGLSPLVTIGGSLIVALALHEDAVSVEEAWNAVGLDEQWQAEQWGADADAELALANRKRDFVAAKRFLDLVSVGD